MNYDVITFILKYRYFKKIWGSHFCWHHQNYNQVWKIWFNYPSEVFIIRDAINIHGTIILFFYFSCINEPPYTLQQYNSILGVNIRVP